MLYTLILMNTVLFFRRRLQIFELWHNLYW